VRRLVVVGLCLLALAGVWGAVRWLVPAATDASTPAWIARRAYPLEHGAALRAAARKYHLDAALVAAVVYAESRFDEHARSPRGALGLMQVLPGTAAQIARETGGRAFVTADLEDPAVNLRYGSYYLRSALDRFGGDTVAAVAAYNAGVATAERWVAAAPAWESGGMRVDEIPYAETRAYVEKVMRLRGVYRRAYGDELPPTS
jgi:soluble lytic murein transglycosylase